MVDWVTVSSFATAGGTLVLALATFASVRSANQAARTAERTLQVNLRPVLFPSRPQDPPEKMMWGDRHWASVPGGRASVEIVDGNIYLAMSLRNVGSGIAVLHGWGTSGSGPATNHEHAEPAVFRMQTRDMYIPAGDISFWQAAIRDDSDRDYAGLTQAITTRERIDVELLYGDHEGGQRAISRFSLIPRQDEQDPGWMCTVVLHWNLDRPEPR
ncbi:MAG TPA: hypothetical protein VII76_07940 [Acidimicrobiales bacterium]